MTTWLAFPPVLPYHSLEARVHLDQEGRFLRQCQHPLFNQRTLYVVVLNDDVLLEYFDGVQLVRSLPLGQHDFAEGSLAQHHQEVEV